MTLQDKVALITGGSRGIGRAIALDLARGGARVAVNFRAESELADAVVREAGGQGLAIQADVSDPTQVDAMVKTVLERWSRIDILVNNAGINRDNLAIRMTDEEWGSVLHTSLSAAFYCSRAVLRLMLRQRWGRVVNISSIVGVRGNAGQANYAAAKAGLIGLTLSLAREVASRNITVNALAPGWIETDMVAAVPEPIRKEALRRIPAGRFGTPEDVSGVVSFLCTDAAGYITGQVIGVDGGMVL